ncbi:MAG: RHS repeat protein, partial [Chthonomonas sp.]|nr:RHS repeat protein [Chthonomonas sp.]
MKQSAWFKLFAVLVSVLMLWNSAFATIFAFQQDSWNSMAGLQKQPNPGRQFSKSPKKPKRSLPRSSYDRDTRGGLWSDASSSAYKTAKIVKESNRGLWTIDSIFCAAQVPTSGEAFPWEGSYGDVNTNTGNKQTSLDIVDWPSRGSLNVAVTLYHSSDAGPDVRPYMQTGWSHSYDIQLEKIIDGGSEYAYVYWGDGTTYPYGALDGNTHEYALPTGIFDRLTTTGTGANQVWTLTTKSQWKYEFNNGGRCTAIKDRWGHQITITWAADALGHYRVTTVADPDARTVTFGYNSSTKLLESITDPASRVFTLTSTSGNLTKVEWPLLSGQSQRNSHQYTYSSGAIASETSRRGKTTSYTYSADGLASETTPAGLVTSYAYETPRDPNYPNDSVGTQITLPKPS